MQADPSLSSTAIRRAVTLLTETPPALNCSVTYLVRKQNKQVISTEFKGISLNGTTGTFHALKESIWFKTAIDRLRKSFIVVYFVVVYFLFRSHITTRREQHLSLHDMYLVGFQGDDECLFCAFTNVWMMLHFFRVLNSEWPIHLMANATLKFVIGISV